MDGSLGILRRLLHGTWDKAGYPKHIPAKLFKTAVLYCVNVCFFYIIFGFIRSWALIAGRIPRNPVAGLNPAPQANSICI